MPHIRRSAFDNNKYQEDVRDIATDMMGIYFDGLDGLARLKAWEIAFQEAIERQFPDKEWWEVVDYQPFEELLAGKLPADIMAEIGNELYRKYGGKQAANYSKEYPSHDGTLLFRYNYDAGTIEALMPYDSDYHPGEVIDEITCYREDWDESPKGMIALYQDRLDEEMAYEYEGLKQEFGLTGSRRKKSASLRDKVMRPRQRG